MTDASVKPEIITEIYRMLRLVRRTEEVIAEIYPSDKIKSPVHLSIGQEAIAVGVCHALNDGDYVSATYRGHAAYIAKGGDLPAMMAELYGKKSGCAFGKAGSMHLIDMDHRILGMSAVVGTTLPVAAGFALANKRSGLKDIVVCFFGDGATEEGVFSETLNFASLHGLPILFVCENNGYAIHTPTSARWATDRLCERVETYGIPTHRMVATDPLAVHDVAAKAVAAVRSGEGPKFIECETYRWREHVGPNEDFGGEYRQREELEPWQETDAVTVLGERLDQARRQEIDAAVEREIAEAVEFADSSPWPEMEHLLSHVFAN